MYISRMEARVDARNRDEGDHWIGMRIWPRLMLIVRLKFILWPDMPEGSKLGYAKGIADSWTGLLALVV